MTHELEPGTTAMVAPSRICASRIAVTLLLILVGVLLIICSVLLILLVIETTSKVDVLESDLLSSSDGRRFRKNICLTAHCVSAAANMLRAMDLHADPCQDFYQFACGHWLRYNPLPEDKAEFNTLSRLGEDLHVLIRALLAAPISSMDSNATRNAKTLFQSCFNLTRIDEKGSDPLFQLLEKLGGWPVIDKNWNEDNFSTTVLLAKLKTYNNDVLFTQWIGPDSKNSSTNIIQIDQPDLGMPSREYFLRGDDKYLRAYKRFMIQTAELLGGNRSVIEKDMKDAVDFEIKLAQIIQPAENRRNYTLMYKAFTLGQLQETVPQIDWLLFMDLVSSQNITSSEPLTVFAIEYLKELGKLLDKTPKRVVSNFVLWRFVKHRVNNLDSRFLAIKQAFFQVMYGRQRQPERWRECVGYVNANMGMAVGSLFVRDYFSNHSKKMAQSMIATIRDSFSELLDHVVWMSDDTKKVAREKAEAVSQMIGYPDYILDAKRLDREYQDLQFDKYNYFENVITIINHLAKADQERLRHPVNKNQWSVFPVNVNAYYSRQRNQIIFPAAILQPPFYHQNYPMSMNYGGVGVVIGHELTHGFDDKGRQYDFEGNLKQWWPEEAIHEFQERAQCIIEQYSNYTIPEIGIQINGVNTQGENIADSGGIKQSFRAYRKWVAKNGEEPVLPGLNFTHNQIFFLNFAQVWCGTMSPEAAITKVRTSSHTPGRFRVIGAVSNSPDFAKAYNCPLGSPMNPKNKCAIW